MKVCDYTNDGVRVIQLNNINDIYFNDENKVFVSNNKADSLKSCNAFPGDLVFAKMMPAGRLCILPNTHERYLLGSDAIRLKLNCSLFDSFFILEDINRTAIRNSITSRTAGSTRQRIGLPELKRTKFYCPELKEQQKIGNFFRLIEEKMAIINNKINTLKKYKKGLCNYLFIDDSISNIHLYDLVNNKPSQLLTKDIEKNVGTYPVYDATGKVLKKIDYYQQESDSVSIIKYGSGCGRTFISKGKHSILGTMTDLIPFDKGNTYFIYAYTNSNSFRRIVKKYTEIGTTPNLYYSDYSTATISLKALTNKDQISKLILNIEEKEDLLNQQLNQLNILKKNLLNLLFI